MTFVDRRNNPISEPTFQTLRKDASYLEVGYRPTEFFDISASWIGIAPMPFQICITHRETRQRRFMRFATEFDTFLGFVSAIGELTDESGYGQNLHNLLKLGPVDKFGRW